MKGRICQGRNCEVLKRNQLLASLFVQKHQSSEEQDGSFHSLVNSELTHSLFVVIWTKMP